MSFKDSKAVIVTEIQTVALGTLADQAALKFTQLTLVEDFRILKSEIVALVVGIDDNDLVAGLLFGIANNNLTVAEIAEAITVQGPLNRNAREEHEQTGRWVKILSAAETLPRGPQSTLGTETVVFRGAGGEPMIISKDRWTYANPEGWCFFLFNNTGSAFATGAIARLSAKHFGVWV